MRTSARVLLAAALLWVGSFASGCRLMGLVELPCDDDSHCPFDLVCRRGACEPLHAPDDPGRIPGRGDGGVGGGADGGENGGPGARVAATLGSAAFARRAGPEAGRLDPHPFVNAVAVAPDGDIYVAGTIPPGVWATFGEGEGNQRDIAPRTGIPADKHQPFVARFSSSGVLQWVRSGTTSGGTDIPLVAALPEGGVVAAGTYRNSITLETGTSSTVTLSGGSDRSVFVIAYGRSGGSLWTARATPDAGGDVLATGVDVGGSPTRIALSGSYKGLLTLSGAMQGSLPRPANVQGYDTSGFVLLLEQNGALAHGVATTLGQGRLFPGEVRVLPDGQIVAVGLAVGAMSWGTSSLSLPAGNEAEVAVALSSSLAPRWLTILHSEREWASGAKLRLATTSTRAIVTGEAAAGISFETQKGRVVMGSSASFVAALDVADGALLWATQAGAYTGGFFGASDTIAGVGIASDGSIAIGGNVYDTATFGRFDVSQEGPYVARLDQNGTFVSVARVSGQRCLGVGGIGSLGEDIVVAGEFCCSARFGVNALALEPYATDDLGCFTNASLFLTRMAR